MAFKLSSTKVLELQSREEVIAKVQELKAFGGTVGEREEKERHEAHIRAKILGDEMVPFNWAVGHVPKQGVSRRVDGQHSGEVFLKLTDEEWPRVQFPVVVVYQEYTCDTTQDLAILFEQFNPKWSARSHEDLIGAHMANYDDLQGVSRYAANAATKGMQWYFHQVEGYTVSGANDHFQLIYKNHDIHAFLRFCGEELKLDKNIVVMASMPVIAAMFHTTRQGSEDDRLFWRRVSGGVHANYDEESHEYKLATFLAQSRDCGYEWPAVIRRSFGARKRPNDVEIFATCLRVFAAWKKGVRITEAFAPVRQKEPAVIASTLYPLMQQKAA